MVAFIVAILVLSLVGNVLPWFNVVAILALFPLRLFWTKVATPDRWLGPRTAIHFAFATYGFWILSYLLTTASVSSLWSYDFLRFKGALFVGYLPLLLFSDVRLSSRLVYRLTWMYLGIMAATAALAAMLIVLLGIGQRFFLNIPILNGFLWIGTGHEMPVMLLGLYRTHMTSGNQYAIASLIALCLILREEKPKVASWASLVFVCLLGGMILSGARTAYVAFAGAFLFQFAMRKKYFKPLARIATLALVTVTSLGLSNPSILRRVSSIVFFEGQDNVTERFRLYRKATEDFAQSPLIGIGFGRFDELGKSYFGIRHVVYMATSANTLGESEYAYQAHDSYLEFLAEGGVVGLFLVLGVWVSTYRWAGWLRRRFRDGSEAAALCEGVQAAVLVTFFSSFTGTSMMMAATPLTVFTVVGLLRNVACAEYRAQTARLIAKARPLGSGPLRQSLDSAAG